MSNESYKKLKIWQRSIAMTNMIYEVTKGFPKDQAYRLVDQLQRSVVSVPSNIAEGCERQTNKEFIQFLYVAKGSLAELETQLIISEMQGYINSDKLKEFESQTNEIDKMIFGLINNLRKKK